MPRFAGQGRGLPRTRGNLRSTLDRAKPAIPLSKVNGT
jgi:hypothetical protein